MPRLGTFTTFDCPIGDQKIAESYEWLKKEFDTIGGTARKVSNPHDFGSYPSFEIDYPSEIEDHNEDDCPDCSDWESENTCPFEKWIEQANEIEERFNKLFHSEE
jgi:hypothetical protein